MLQFMHHSLIQHSMQLVMPNPNQFSGITVCPDVCRDQDIIKM